MKLTYALLVVVVVGCQAHREHAETAPVSNSTAPAPPAPSPMPTADDIARGEAMALAAAQAEAAKDGSIVVKGLPLIPPQAKWEARIRAGGNPIIVAEAGQVVVSPFYQPSPGIWQYVVQEPHVFALPIMGDALPTADEGPTNLPGGRTVTSQHVHIAQKSSGATAEVVVIPWPLPEPGQTIDDALDAYMVGELAATGLTTEKVIHGPVGGAPGVLATAKGKVAGVDYQAMLWKIYLPDAKRVIAYSLYSTAPEDLRAGGDMMLKLFKVGDEP